MAFKYGEISPTEIIYNGTPLTVLKYGNEGVWGKPYSLSISQGSNTTVTVNRISSPNQHAETGVLPDGSVIYYGDVITVSYSVSTNYQIKTHTINGVNFTSGQEITISEGLSIITTAESSASWHTLWSGNKNITSNTLITTTSQLALQYRATVTTTNETWQYDYPQTVVLYADVAKNVIGTWEMGGGDLADETCGTLKITPSMSGTNTNIYATFASRTGSDSGDPYTMIITKLEGYY